MASNNHTFVIAQLCTQLLQHKLSKNCQNCQLNSQNKLRLKFIL